MHWLDALYLRLPRERLFENGWGAWERVLDLARPFLVPAEEPVLPVAWSRAVRWAGVERRLGVARSPCELASEGVERVRVLRLSPATAPRARAIVPPSWGDEGFVERSVLLLPLVRRGVELWLLEGAYFGGRRPPGQQGVGVRTVGELLAMGLCDLMELRGLVAAARAEAPAAPVLLCGFSMAGQFSAQVAATLPWDIPVIAMSPSDSAVPVFIEGPLSRGVQWSALGDDARPRLQKVLSQFGVRMLAPPPTKKRVLLASRHDGIVPPTAMERVAAHWQVTPRWLDSGHLGAFFFHGKTLRQAVLECL